MLQLRGVTVHRGKKRVVDDATMAVASGTIAVLRGRSGSGKSSLLSAIAGLIPSSGQIAAGGEMQPRRRDDAAAWRAKHLGIVDQETDLLPELTISENVRLPLELARKKAPQRVESLLARFGLDSIASKRADQVSGGERQRGAIARGLVTGADILLVDEPTSALDEANAKSVIAALQQAAAAGAAVLVATHDPLLFDVGTQYEIHDGKVQPCTA